MKDTAIARHDIIDSCALAACESETDAVPSLHIVDCRSNKPDKLDASGALYAPAKVLGGRGR